MKDEVPAIEQVRKLMKENKRVVKAEKRKEFFFDILKALLIFGFSSSFFFIIPFVIFWGSPVWWTESAVIVVLILWGIVATTIAYRTGKEEGYGSGYKVRKEEDNLNYHSGYERGFDDAINKRNVVIKQGD